MYHYKHIINIITCIISIQNIRMYNNNKTRFTIKLMKFVSVFSNKFFTSVGTKGCNNLLQNKCVLWVDVVGAEATEKLLRRGSLFVHVWRYTQPVKTTRVGKETKRILYVTNIHPQKPNDRAVHDTEGRAHLLGPLKIKTFAGLRRNSFDDCESKIFNIY